MFENENLNETQQETVTPTPEEEIIEPVEATPVTEEIAETPVTEETQPPEEEQPKKKQSNKGVWVFLGILVCAIIASGLIIAVSLKHPVTDTPDYVEQNPESTTEITQNSTPGVEYTVSEDGILTVPEIVDKVKPSVVGIVTESGFGSGFFISTDGYILTNAHVVANSQSLTVYDSNEKTYNATIVGSDNQTDIAVIKVEGADFPAVEIGDSDMLKLGETVVAIGNPRSMELYASVTSGIVSGLDRTISVEGIDFNLIQTDASINSGNSGGALINHFGQVIGITNAKFTGSEGLGFAIPANTAIPIVNELITNGRVTGRPVIGIMGQDLNTYYGMKGVYVTDVRLDSDAYKKGLQPGDIITAINGEEVSTVNSLSAKIGSMNAGDTVTLFVYRNGRYFTLDVKLMPND